MPKITDLYEKFLSLKLREQEVINKWNKKNGNIDLRKLELEVDIIKTKQKLLDLEIELKNIENGNLIPTTYYNYGIITSDIDLITEDIKQAAQEKAKSDGDEYLAETRFDLNNEVIANEYNKIYEDAYVSYKEKHE